MRGHKLEWRRALKGRRGGFRTMSLLIAIQLVGITPQILESFYIHLNVPANLHVRLKMLSLIEINWPFLMNPYNWNQYSEYRNIKIKFSWYFNVFFLRVIKRLLNMSTNIILNSQNIELTNDTLIIKKMFFNRSIRLTRLLKLHLQLFSNVSLFTYSQSFNMFVLPNEKMFYFTSDETKLFNCE